MTRAPRVAPWALAAAVGLGAAACEPPPEPHIEAIAVRVTGADYQWIVRYPGADNVLGPDTEHGDDTFGIHDVHVPAGARVTLHIASRDLLYSFRIPDLKVRAMAVPDIPFKAEFTAPAVGRYPLLGDQFCGYSHPSLISELIVDPPGRFLAWQTALRELNAREPPLR